MSAVVVGSGALAETMVGMLSAAGKRVAMLAPSAKIQEGNFKAQVIKSILQDDSEKKIPFEFVDDIRQQQIMAKRNFDKILITTNLSKIDEYDQIIDATSADETALLHHTIAALPQATLISIDEKSPINDHHVLLKLYSPIIETKMVTMRPNANTSSETIEQVRQLLDSMGFTVLSKEDSLVADRLVNDMQEAEKSTPLSKLVSVLMHPMNEENIQPIQKEQFQIYH
ncbi:unnamed protein product [Caenorhabditis bovis]|uniref:Uncharacterized protein n=1 Tax=Caenorhabditis bovis TaxID=2654633 RepID=A0A8S1DZ90_9PELO|nr:unnamed protein product [Caenorhabditis bovis]